MTAHSGLELVSVASIVPTPVSWLWRHRFAMGHLSIVAGIQGLGKSFLTCDMAARITRGEKWPDGAPAPQKGSVVFLADEDGDEIRNRLEAAGADLDRVKLLRAKADCGPARIPGDMAWLHGEIADLGDVRLVVIDPLDAYLADGADENKNGDVRPLVEACARLAKATGVHVAGVRHTRKGEAGSAVHRVAGARVWTSIPRMVWGLGVDRSSPDLRVLVNVKANLKAARPLRFHIAEHFVGGEDVGRLEWVGGEPLGDAVAEFAGAGEMHSKINRRGAMRQAAKKLLLDQLAKGKKVKEEKLLKLSKAVCSPKTLQRAAEEIGVKMDRGAWFIPAKRAA